MKVGDLVKATVSGMGGPERSVMGMLVKPMLARTAWSVRLLKDQACMCFANHELEVVNATR